MQQRTNSSKKLVQPIKIETCIFLQKYNNTKLGVLIDQKKNI